MSPPFAVRQHPSNTDFESSRFEGFSFASTPAARPRHAPLVINPQSLSFGPSFSARTLPSDTLLYSTWVRSGSGEKRVETAPVYCTSSTFAAMVVRTRVPGVRYCNTRPARSMPIRNESRHHIESLAPYPSPFREKQRALLQRRNDRISSAFGAVETNADTADVTPVRSLTGRASRVRRSTE